jgi:hypothetical protein
VADFFNNKMDPENVCLGTDKAAPMKIVFDHEQKSFLS